MDVGNGPRLGHDLLADLGNKSARSRSSSDDDQLGRVENASRRLDSDALPSLRCLLIDNLTHGALIAEDELDTSGLCRLVYSLQGISGVRVAIVLVQVPVPSGQRASVVLPEAIPNIGIAVNRHHLGLDLGVNFRCGSESIKGVESLGGGFTRDAVQESNLVEIRAK